MAEAYWSSFYLYFKLIYVLFLFFFLPFLPLLGPRSWSTQLHFFLFLKTQKKTSTQKSRSISLCGPTNYSWEWGLPWRVMDVPRLTQLKKKKIFPLPTTMNWNNFLFRDDALFSLPLLHVRNLSNLSWCKFSAGIRCICEFLCALVLLSLLNTICYLASPLALTVSLPPIPPKSLSL